MTLLRFKTTMLVAMFFLFHWSSLATAGPDVFLQCRTSSNMNVRIRACTHIIKYHATRRNLFHAYHDRGIAWWNKGNLKRALADFNAALRYNPGDADTRRHRRDVLAEMRQRRNTSACSPRSASHTYRGVSTPLPQMMRHECVKQQVRR